jgi:hypothetical protein
MLNIDLRYFEDAWNAVLGAAPLTGITAAQIAWPEKTFTPTKGVPFIRAEMTARNRRPMGFGADCVQEWTGIYQIAIFVPRDGGTRLQNEIASKVLTAFPRGLTAVTPQGIVMIVTRSTTPSAVPWNDWINLPVQIEWFAHEPP